MWLQVTHAEALQLAQGGPQTVGINQDGLDTLTDELNAFDPLQNSRIGVGDAIDHQLSGHRID